MNNRILIVDDEAIALDNLKYILTKEGYEITPINNGKEALDLIKDTEFDLIITDLKMPRVDGMEILNASASMYPNTEVIIVTGYATIDSAIRAMKDGAYHYITKPYKIDEVRKLVKEAIEKRSLKLENNALRNNLRILQEGSLITEERNMLELLDTAKNVAASDCNVLITGESGTGKELIARYIHNHSSRKNQEMLAVNCGVFSEELLASELFGHEKGAFTGADKKKVGILQSAENSTILLDEITEMSLSMQVKLLRVLQEKEVMPVGSTRPEKVNVRFIAATNRDIVDMIRKNQFRQDLYYRINVVNLHLPSLSERRSDIPVLVHYFIDKFNILYKKNIREIADDAMAILKNYDFPGNIRELEHIIERAIVLAHTDIIEAAHLPDMEINTFRNIEGKLLSLEEYERKYIEWVLKKCRGKKARAAEILGIDRVSLWRKLKKYGYDESMTDMDDGDGEDEFDFGKSN